MIYRDIRKKKTPKGRYVKQSPASKTRPSLKPLEIALQTRSIISTVWFAEGREVNPHDGVLKMAVQT